MEVNSYLVCEPHGGDLEDQSQSAMFSGRNIHNVHLTFYPVSPSVMGCNKGDCLFGSARVKCSKGNKVQFQVCAPQM